MNNFKYGTNFLFFKFTDSQGHAATLRHNLQTKHVFSECARSEAGDDQRCTLDNCVN